MKIELNRRLKCCLIEKIESEWPLKWAKNFGVSYDFNLMKNQNAFLEYLILDIEKTLKFTIGIEKTITLGISSDNLRRILKNEVSTTWHERTRNTLAYYVGFDGWEDFVNSIQRSSIDEKKSNLSKIYFFNNYTFNVKLWFACLIFGFLILFGIYKYFFSLNEQLVFGFQDYSSYPEYLKTFATIPKYSFSNYKIGLENENFQYLNLPNYHKVRSLDDTISFNFFTPGLKKLSLYKNDVKINQKPFLVSTNKNWYGCARVKQKTIIKKDDNGEATAWYGPMNIYKNSASNYLTTPEIWNEYNNHDVKKNNVLSFPKSELGNSKLYFNRVIFFKSENFQLDMNNLNLEFDAKRENLPSEDCLSFMLELVDEKFQSFEYYSSNKCKLNANVSTVTYSDAAANPNMKYEFFANDQLNGILEDFQWHHVSLKISDVNLQIALDSKIIVNTNYIKHFRNLREIKLVLEGNGYAKNIVLKNLKSKVKLFSDFTTP